MGKTNLLLCFDAFGTLFRPKWPVASQYATVARQCGLRDIPEHDLQASLAQAFNNETKSNPNYGKSTGLGATLWWTNVIVNTFSPLLPPGQSMPSELAPRLIHRFASREAYETEGNIVESIRRLKTTDMSRRFSRIVVGVITNSDDRVPRILTSFGLRVSPLRCGHEPHADLEGETDIDFHCMSYDVGVEKPDPRIFNAAEQMLPTISAGHAGAPGGGASHQSTDERWLKMYVGDDYRNDVEGARGAGWVPILLDPSNQWPRYPLIGDCDESDLNSLPNLESTLRAQSIRDLTSWLVGKS